MPHRITPMSARAKLFVNTQKGMGAVNSGITISDDSKQIIGKNDEFSSLIVSHSALYHAETFA